MPAIVAPTGNRECAKRNTKEEAALNAQQNQDKQEYGHRPRTDENQQKHHWVMYVSIEKEGRPLVPK